MAWVNKNPLKQARTEKHKNNKKLLAELAFHSHSQRLKQKAP